MHHFRNHGRITKRQFLLALTAMLMLPVPAAAYVGPGLGVAAIWVLLGPLAALIILVLIIAYYPLRYYYKKYIQYRGRDGQQDTTPDDSGHNDDNSHSDV